MRRSEAEDALNRIAAEADKGGPKSAQQTAPTGNQPPAEVVQHEQHVPAK